jgi:hypothetical protein
MPAAPVGSASLATADSFWTQVLVDGGWPITQSNIEALRAWSKLEGGGGAWNPLNSTNKMPGSTLLSGNRSGVQNYTSAAEGASATAANIGGPHGSYPSIAAAFASGNAFGALVSGGQGPIGQQLRKWSGGAYNNVPYNGGAYVSPTFGGTGGGGFSGPAPSNASNTGSAATGPCNTLAQSISNASGPASAVPGEQQIAGFFGWITQGCVQKRLLIQGISALLILYGLKFMGHSDPLKIVTAPVKAGRDAVALA